MAKFAWLEGVLVAIGTILLSLLATSPPAAAQSNPLDQPMRFVLVRHSSPTCGLECPEWISAEGTVTADTAKKLKAVLAKVGTRKLPILINSPGGHVDAALAAGRLIRSKGLDVAVAYTMFTDCSPSAKGCKPDKDGFYRGVANSYYSFCNSACPWILAGGTRRLAGPLAYVGVHQMTTTVVKERVYYRTEYKLVKGKKKVVSKKVTGRKKAGSYTTTKLTSAQRKKMLAYQTEMGMDAGFLDLAQKTDAKDISRIAPGELVSMGLVTGWEDATTLVSATICVLVPIPAHCRVIQPPPPKSQRELAEERVAAIEKSNSDITKEMRFALVRGSNSLCEPLCPEWIMAEGRLTANSAGKLKKLIESLGDQKPPVVLSSLGGKAEVAMEIGRLIRKSGLPVVVGNPTVMGCSTSANACQPEDGQAAPTHVGTASSGGSYCLAECILVLAAGGERGAGIGAQAGWLPAASPSKKLAARIEAYLKEMRVPARVLKEDAPAPLTQWAQWRLLKLELLTAATGAEQTTSAASCSSNPGLCRESKAKPRAASAAKPQAVAAAPGKQPMAFVHVRGSSPLCDPHCPEWISAEGLIVSDSPRQLDEMLSAISGRRLPVIINSQGGDVIAAMALGRLIRKRGLDTAVAGTRFLPCGPLDADCLPSDGSAYAGVAIDSWGKCVAACPVVLAGGVRRLVGRGAYIGIHEVALLQKVEAYFVEMGVSFALASAMQQARYGGDRKLEFEKTIEFKLATSTSNVDELAAPNVCRNFPKTDNCRLIEATQ